VRTAVGNSIRLKCEHTFVPAYSEKQAREAVASSLCYSEALQKLGLRPAGGNHRVFRKYVDEIWRIPTDHFDPQRVRIAKLKANRPQRPIPLELVRVSGSSYSRTKLKQRLYESGLKTRNCELCDQGEDWRGGRMSLILDHVNGVPDDNRIENLRIVCPNCAATIETHCGRKNRLPPQACAMCGNSFTPRYRRQRYCSVACGMRHPKGRHAPRPERRKVERPSYEQLMADVGSMSFVAIGRNYGVSDNAVRKWIRWYEYQREMEVWSKQEGESRKDAA
jgi:hypothetical protein